MAVEVMRDRGIDISAQRPKPLSRFEGCRFDLLITTCDDANQACPYFPGARKRLHWSIPDPAKATGTPKEIRASFSNAGNELERRIRELLG